MIMLRSGVGIGILGVLFSTAGCVVGSARSTVQGEYVSQSSSEGIIPGETTTEWLLAELGPPSARCQFDDGTERLTYRFTRKDRAKFGVFPLVGFSFTNERLTTVEVQTRDGVVEAVYRHHA